MTAEKFGPNSSGHLTPRVGAKKRFLGSTMNFYRPLSLQRNMISTIGKKLVNLQGLPYMPPNLVNFGPERLRTVGEFCPSP